MANVLELKFQLPTKNGEIDYNFMESFIAELEARHIAELEAYLSVTGLTDYNLSRNEQKILSDYLDGKIGYGKTTFLKRDKLEIMNIYFGQMKTK